LKKGEDTRSDTIEWYREYYLKHGSDRNSLLNPEVLLQVVAAEMAMIAGYRTCAFDPANAEVLDVGCGNGQSLLIPLSLGSNPSKLCGLDIISERIEAARTRLGGVRFECGDASRMPFDDCRFDVVQASTMFVQLTDDAVASPIASEMVRVTRPGGHILVCDWRYNKPGEPQYKAVTRSRLSALFSVGDRTEIRAVHRGALVPPIGRRLSRRGWAGTYFALQRLLPFLVGQVVTVLEKR
jgi:SAM-dependent methyltransferase